MTKLHYRKQGNGPVILLLHGFCESASIWDDLIGDLKHQYQLIAIDLFGHGATALSEDNSINAMAEACFDLMDYEKVSEFLLIGHSMGGYVGLRMAEIATQRIVGICLLNSHCFADDLEKVAQRKRAIEHLRHYGSDTFIKELFYQLFKEPKQHQQVVNQLTDNALKIPVDNLIAAYEAMIDRKGTSEFLKNYSGWLALVIGEADRSIPFELQRAQLCLTNRTLVKILPESGHMSLFENYPEVRNTILKWADICH